MATSTRRRALGALVSLALFLAALWVLRGELREHTAAAALIAQVPGGLGIIEAVVVWALGPRAGAPAVAGAVLAYRAIYFVLPPVLATGLWGGREMARWGRRRRA